MVSGHHEHSHHGHQHKHEHGHHHHHAPESFNLAFGLSVSLNLLFCLIEAFYAIAANSMSLLADAGHNLGDVLGLGFAWTASWLVTKGATAKYSYGLKRTTILAALLNSLILVAATALIVYESLRKLIHPEPLNELIVITIALIGIAINGGTAMLFMRGRKEDLNIKGAFLHLAYDALISLGVVITGVIILFTHFQRLDPVVGIVIAVLILLGTWGLLRDSVNLILDAIPHHIDRKKIEAYLRNLDGVTAVHDLHIWGLSTNEVALTCHLVIPDKEFRQQDYKKINHDLAHDFKINHVTIQIEKGFIDEHCGQVCD